MNNTFGKVYNVILLGSVIVIGAAAAKGNAVNRTNSRALKEITGKLAVVTNQLETVRFVTDNALKQNEVLQLIYMNTLGQYIDALNKRRPSDLSREELALIQRYRPEEKFAKELAKRQPPESE